MGSTGRLLALIAISGAAGCGPASPARPSAHLDYAGTWAGPTSQGGMITFAVSPEGKVVAIGVGYNLNGCSGTATLSGLALEVSRPELAPGSPNAGGPFDNPSFGTGSAGLGQPDFLGVAGSFTSSDTARGVLTFGDYGGCGSGTATWTAAKR